MEATTISSDYPDALSLEFGGLVHDGNPGHPRINIRPEDLANLSVGCLTHQQIADIYGCSARTIRRRLLEYQEDGSIQCIYAAGANSDLSQLLDNELDIERLWVDITHNFGGKWKDFFMMLEIHDGLNVDADAHIWLLHHLFLSVINCDAEVWVETWNHHILSQHGKSPCNMYLCGMIEHGYCRVHVDDPLNDDNIVAFGIKQNNVNNAQTWAHYDDSFIVNHPDHLSHVEVPDTCCLFALDQLSVQAQLSTSHLLTQNDMPSHQLLWIHALSLARNIVD
ncbi:hypothetical protein J132_01147 [Termitomyces sp. J132]|nr:hypothetical protein J132_01147 [Termitomyces sp. J132]